MEMEISTAIILIVCSIIGLVVYIKFFKWGIKNYSDDEIMQNFSFGCCLNSLLSVFWIALIIGGIFNANKFLTPEVMTALSEVNINIDAVMENLPKVIFMLAMLVGFVLLIPIINIIYFHKHKKLLKEYTYKNYTYKQIARKHFFMGLFSPIFIPFLIAPNLFMVFLKTGSSKKYTSATSTIRDSKGNKIYVDTVIDNETGLGSVKYTDEKGNSSYHYVDTK